MPAWDTVIDALVDLERANETDEGQRYLARFLEDYRQKRELSVDEMASMLPPLLALPYCTPIWVAEEIVDLVESAAQTWEPEPILATDLVVPAGFAYFEKPIVTVDRKDFHTAWRAMHWIPIRCRSIEDSVVKDGLLFALYSDANDNDDYTPQTVMCDFCSSPDVKWGYPARSFDATVVAKSATDVAGLPWGSKGGWAACDICSSFIEANNWDELIQRQAVHFRARYEREVGEDRVPFEEHLGAFRQLITLFRQHRIGRRVTDAQARQLERIIVGGSHLTLLHFTAIVYGDSVNNEELDPRAIELISKVQTLWRLAKQEVAAAHPQLVGRHARKRAKKAGREAETTQVMRLRRTHHQRHDTEEHSVEWSRRWLVNGHWRQQFYPSINAHRQIWIAPYVKGPDDQPFIPKARVVDFSR